MDFHFFSPQTISTVVATFLASFVEFVEALTIILAVGVSRGWKPALLGAAAGALLLTLMVLIFGSAIQSISLENLQLIIGSALLLFGLRWLRKAILRAAGVIPLHDEEKIYHQEIQQLNVQAELGRKMFIDSVAFLTVFKAMILEGIEVVFIVITMGSAAHSLGPAAAGAAAAGILVIFLGLMIHRPLARVPENTLKFCVALLLSSFGTFWVGEGLNYSWPGKDLALLYLLAGFCLASILGIQRARRQKPK